MLFAMVKAKASSLLSQPKEKVKNYYLRCSLHLFEEDKKMRMTSSKGDIAVILKRKRWGFCGLLEKMEVWVFWVLSSKIKKCDLWWASDEVWLWSLGEMKNKKRESWRRELERVCEVENENESMCEGGRGGGLLRALRKIFSWFCC